MDGAEIVANVTRSIYEWISNNILTVICIIGYFVQISPIKIEPFTILANWFFKPVRNEMTQMRNDFNKALSDLENKISTDINNLRQENINEKQEIEKLIESNEMSEISRIRWEIIEFANSLDNKQLHIRDEYRHIIDDNKRYHTLIDKYGLENGFIDEEMEKITKHYEDNKHSNNVYF